MDMIPVQSRAIAEVGYDPAASDLGLLSDAKISQEWPL